MKNKICMAVFMILGVLLTKVVLANQISVYFMGFGVETYTPVTREKIIHMGELIHPSDINSITIMALLSINDGISFYFSDQRIRAMVTDGEKTYYIDEEGVVYKNNRVSTMINRELLTELLREK
ncbi:hypothetical protein [Rahnella selenatireducens]|uniref:hypothetical protein n=1 Tax=Rahnella selenatireducens TaxID=3389797 RepID=UPI0039685A5D